MRTADPACLLLGETWAEVEAAAAENLRASEARITRWVWASQRTEWEAMEPLWVERRGERPGGGVLYEPPSNLADAVLYGYDGTELVLARRFRESTLADPDVREYVLRASAAPGTRVQACFYHPIMRSSHVELLRIERATFRQGRTIAVDVWSAPAESGAHMREEYVYEGDRLTAIEYSFRSVASPDPLRYICDVQYDETGKLRTIVKRQEGKPAYVLYRATPSAAVRKARKQVVTQLVDGWIAWANRIDQPDTVCALAVAYDAESADPLPPTLGVLTLTDLANVTGHEPEDVWNPAEFPGFDPAPQEFEDTQFLEACRVVNRFWAEGSDIDAPRKMLVDVAKRVKARSAEISLEHTDDLVIYAVDLELVDLARNLRATAHREAVAAIERRAGLSGP